MFSRFISEWSPFRTLFPETRSEPNKEEKSNFQYELNNEEKRQLRRSESKPKVVALYEEHDGAANADLAIQHFEDEGLGVVRVSSNEGLDHPAFTDESIDGIYLPGGSDIPVDDDNDPRKKFEGQLAKLARTKDIPLFGVCRGEQALGHHNSLDVEDLPEYEQHYAGADNSSNPESNNTVVVEQGSQLFAALQNEFKEDSSNGSIEYPVKCLHHQHIRDDSRYSGLQVTGRNKFDNTIESIEIRTGKYYSLGVQHHPEVLISASENTRKEKISQVEKEAHEARFRSNFFDSDTVFDVERTYAQKLREAQIKTKEERAARAEMSFFTKQVKKHFLEQPKQEVKQSSIGDSGVHHTLWI
ncbi:gamma-glutamyl-gamma-aminobutyrate hydrolase family protein [Legionella sp. WA2022007384]